MKSHRILAGACLALSLCLLAGLMTLITSTSPKKAYGNVQSGMPVAGVSQLVVTGTNALNLASTAATAGTSSVPCNNLQLQVSGGSALMGVSAGTASCTYPLYANSTSGTAGTMSYQVPCTNTNQLWFYASNGTTTINAVYAQ